jgi:hypothetical protein
VKLHLLCSTERVPISYELSPANEADISPTEDLVAEAFFGGRVAWRRLGNLAYCSVGSKEAMAEVGILLATQRAERRREARQQAKIAISSLRWVFGLGETLASTRWWGRPPRPRRRSAPTPTASTQSVFWVFPEDGSSN